MHFDETRSPLSRVSGLKVRPGMDHIASTDCGLEIKEFLLWRLAVFVARRDVHSPSQLNDTAFSLHSLFTPLHAMPS